MNTSVRSRVLFLDDSIFWRSKFPDSIERMSTKVMDGIYKNLRRDQRRSGADKEREVVSLVKSRRMRVGTSTLFGLDSPYFFEEVFRCVVSSGLTENDLWGVHRETERHWGITCNNTSSVQPVDGKVIS